MHAAALILALALGTGGTASPAGPRPVFVVNGVERLINLTNAQASIVMEVSGEVTSLNWTQVTPGIGTTFTVAVTVDGAPACTLPMACNAAVGDYVAACSGATFQAGDDVDVRVTANGCLPAPIGFPSFAARQ